MATDPEKNSIDPAVPEIETPPVSETPEKPKKGKTVEIPVDLLEKLSAQLEELSTKVETLQKDNKKLTYASDKKRIADYESRLPADELNHKCTIGVIDGQYVIGWEKVKDEVYVGDNGVVYADQSIKVFYKGGTAAIMTYLAFSRNVKRETVEVIKEELDKKTKVEIWTLVLPSGENVDIDTTFINL